MNDSNAMMKELRYIEFEKREAIRQQELVKVRELTNKIRPVIFPCMTTAPAMADTSKYNERSLK